MICHITDLRLGFLLLYNLSPTWFPSPQAAAAAGADPAAANALYTLIYVYLPNDISCRGCCSLSVWVCDLLSFLDSLPPTWFSSLQAAAAAGADPSAAKAAGMSVTLAGLRLHKGMGPLVGVYLHGLMTGSPDLREAAAAALGEAVELTPAETLKPFVIQITGPLIRCVVTITVYLSI